MNQNTHKAPPPLKAGCRVAIVATARKINTTDLDATIQLLHSWGLDVVVPQGVEATYGQLAGTDDHRAKLLQQAIDDTSIHAILCACGGYGTVRIIDRIDFSSLQTNPKWIIGYSDITVLHSHIHQHTSCQTLHAIMPINITHDALLNSTPATNTLHDLLFGLPIQPYAIPPHKLNQAGTATAPVVGGNLSILYSLCGSDSDIDTRGKILMIEDIDEYLYHIDRMMQNMQRTGKLSQLAGLIVGQFTDMHDNAVPFSSDAYHIISQYTQNYDYPVLFNAPFGHVGTRNLAIPIGSVISITVHDNQPSTIQL
ncbi:MAG: LD-carboxypeptidase [Bacteroidales bacterium]|nr:LD-carboxypeptidase [Candidatus Colimorpha onthohippi]